MGFYEMLINVIFCFERERLMSHSTDRNISNVLYLADTEGLIRWETGRDGPEVPQIAMCLAAARKKGSLTKDNGLNLKASVIAEILDPTFCCGAERILSLTKVGVAPRDLKTFVCLHYFRTKNPSLSVMELVQFIRERNKSVGWKGLRGYSPEVMCFLLTKLEELDYAIGRTEKTKTPS